MTKEIDATDLTALEAVKNVDEERLKLEKEAEKLAAQVSAIWLFSAVVIVHILLMRQFLFLSTLAQNNIFVLYEDLLSIYCLNTI